MNYNTKHTDKDKIYWNAIYPTVKGIAQLVKTNEDKYLKSANDFIGTIIEKHNIQIEKYAGENINVCFAFLYSYCNINH